MHFGLHTQIYAKAPTTQTNAAADVRPTRPNTDIRIHSGLNRFTVCATGSQCEPGRDQQDYA
jgi:hypothetical protein